MIKLLNNGRRSEEEYDATGKSENKNLPGRRRSRRNNKRYKGQGLAAAEKDLRVNMTLCFTQEQAAAVHGATRGASRRSFLVSPFIGSLDDMGYNGMELIQNIMKIYRKEGSHVETLVASVRST